MEREAEDAKKKVSGIKPRVWTGMREMEPTHRREAPGKSCRERLLEGLPPMLAPPSL